jgi:NADH-quinone oxidoreductase subunit F
MLEILTDITEGRGTMEHIELLEKLADTISATALCGLGKTAASPVISTLKYFREEYIAHVVDKKCPAGQCKALMTLQIDPTLCRGCTKCARMCPVGAITGKVKTPHVIDTTKCIKCGACKDGCSFGAVTER